jgi:hypothetical protein
VKCLYNKQKIELRANQIARIISDFKMDIIKLDIKLEHSKINFISYFLYDVNIYFYLAIKLL